MKPIRRAAPRPVLRPSHETCRQGVAFNVSARAYDIRGFLERLGFEPSLVDRSLSNGAAMTVMADGMGNGYPVHQPGEARRVRRTHDQMPVIGEDAIGSSLAAVARACFKHCEEGP
jgi:hypothetical protein